MHWQILQINHDSITLPIATLSEHLNSWVDELRPYSPTPRLDAEVLFKHASGLCDARIIIDADQGLNDILIARTRRLIDRRKIGKPIAYITGCREFYGLDIKLNEHVLIPRPETELLVDHALDILANNDNRVLDLGTGSGAIALALAVNVPNLQVLAVDNNINALKVAQNNAARLQLNQIQFMCSHWFTRLAAHTFDLIVANPPYVAPDDVHLKQGDARFEPRTALASSEDGLADLKQIIQGATGFLNAGASLAVEHGYDQGARVRKIFNANSYQEVKTFRDLAGIERVTIGQQQW